MFELLRKLHQITKDFATRRKIQSAMLKLKRSERKIILVAGHHRAGFWHGRDPGAVANGTNEHYEAEKVCYKAAQILTKGQYSVVVLPFDLDLQQKIKLVNQHYKKEDILISVHLNAHHTKASGTETWYLSGNNELRRNAGVIQAALVKRLGLSDRGVRGDLQNHHGSLGILRATNTQEDYLIELGFITNAKDLDKIRNHGAQAVADAAIAAFYY